MLLLICILFNSYIGIVFKLFEKYEIRILQAIVVNYFVCALTASVMIGRPAVTMDVFHKPWTWAAILLGLNFVVSFNLFAQTVQKFGVVIGGICQKMSLIIPVLAAILYYGESANAIKVVGILIAIASIFIISLSGANLKSTKLDKTKISPLIWIFPIGTFIGGCFVDFGLFYVNKSGLANSNDIDFIASLFFFSGCFGVIFVIYDYFKNKITFRKKDIIAGFALGIPNFFSIYFLIKVLSNGMDGSVVFPINNVGIIVTSAILGLFFFSEKFNTQKIIGLTLAIAAIVMIAIG